MEEIETQAGDEQLTEPVIGLPPEVPDAQIIFDYQMADEWLRYAYKRLEKVYRSVRFEARGIPPQHIGFLLSLVSKSILPEYKNKKNTRVTGKGVLYVPDALADHGELSWLERGEQVGEYIAFHRK